MITSTFDILFCCLWIRIISNVKSFITFGVIITFGDRCLSSSAAYMWVTLDTSLL